MENASGPSTSPIAENKRPRAEDQDDVPSKKTKKMLKLKLEANDGAIVEVEEDVAKVSITLKDMIENLNIGHSEADRLNDAIPVELNGAMLNKVMEFCTRYRDREYIPKSQRDTNQVTLDDWDTRYLMIDETQFELLYHAANYMNIPQLMEAQAQLVADSMADYDVPQLREAFGVVNDFTPEEEEDLRKQYSWAETWNFKKVSNS